MTGESKIHENESLPFYAAYRALENRLTNLSYVEFGLLVFDDDIRIFETRPDEEGYLAQLSGCGYLNEVGIADSVSNESTPLESTLTRFRYAKADIERLTPDYRYIPFDSACEEIAAFAGKSKSEIKQHLIDVANRNHICPHHPYCGFVQPEHDYLWLDSAYPEYEIDKILRDEFGISEFEIAFDVEAYLDELKDNVESAGEIKRIRDILNRRVVRHADLVIRQNAIAELMTLRPDFRNNNKKEYEKTSDDLIKQLSPLPKIPSIKDRSIRYVWLNILNKRKAKVDADNPSDARITELGNLNKTINEIQQQLGCLGTEQVDVVEEQAKAEAVGNGGAGSQTETIGDDRVRAGGYRERDLDAIAWLAEMKKDKTDFDLDVLTNPQIETALKARNSTLWGKGFSGWNRKQRVWPKKRKGIKRQLKP